MPWEPRTGYPRLDLGHPCFKGQRGIRYPILKPNFYCGCGNKVVSKGNQCRLCSRKGRDKIVWPTQEELAIMVWEKPASHLAKELGVSDVSISKRCKQYNIAKPPRGYWEKKYHSKEL